jgi:hypothetical protein
VILAGNAKALAGFDLKDPEGRSRQTTALSCASALSARTVKKYCGIWTLAVQIRQCVLWHSLTSKASGNSIAFEHYALATGLCHRTATVRESFAVRVDRHKKRPWAIQGPRALQVVASACRLF